MSDFEIQSANPWMPHGLAALVDESSGLGMRNVSTLVGQWADGTQRFGDTGERALVAVGEGVVVGVGGLTKCPHVSDALRVRRFYVAREWRRRGVARAIANELLDGGRQHTDLFSCNARASDAAPPFWESLGFVPTDEIEGVTHTMVSGRSG